jgi:voltage-gated potassium channel
LHEGALIALQEANVIGEPNLLTWAAIGILTIGLVFMIPRVSYDRMGVGRREERWLNWFAWTSIVGKLVVVIAGTIVVLIIALRIVLSLEGEEAISRNVDNTLLEFDFLEAVAWMFTFIASGYENDVFPLSNVARVSVAFLAFVGLGLPLWFILNVVAEHAERVLDRDKGLHDQRLSGHTLVCGWNEKAPGVIYTLTCFQSPHRRKVVIVADMDSEQPVKEWRFHRGRVRFCRGDASMGRVLQRAKAHLAENAIVLASDDDDDQSGVLTALAVRKLNPTAFITAELARKSDEDYFTTSEVNKIVDPTEISNGAITLACFSSYALDYAMDALSPDEEAEWYSMEASKLDRLLARQNRTRTVGACIEALSEFNINVIGIASPTTMGNADEFVVDGTYIDPLYTTGSLSQEISDDSFVICAARNLLSFRLARTRFYLRRIANLIPGITSRQPSKVEVKSTAICTTKEPALDILIVGGMEKATQLAEYMTRSIGREPDLLIVEGSESLGSMKAKLAEVQPDKPWTHVVVLAMPAQGRSKHSSSRIDAKTILRAHLIQDALKQRQLSPLLVSEVLNVDNRQLFEEADIDIVVPTAICTERILARMAAGRGFVSTMLTSLISREDGVYLTSIRLDENHTLVGEYFNDVLTTYFEDGRVMAVLPRVERDRFENTFDDFGTHFIMNPTAHNPKLEADDIVIVLRHA